MATVTVVNQSREPQMLDDGTQLGAAHTPEARREGVTLSEGDRRRLVDTGRVVVIQPARQPARQPPPAAAGGTPRFDQPETAKEAK